MPLRIQRRFKAGMGSASYADWLSLALAGAFPCLFQTACFLLPKSSLIFHRQAPRFEDGAALPSAAGHARGQLAHGRLTTFLRGRE